MSLVFSKLTYYFSKQSKKKHNKKKKKNKKLLLHLVPFFFSHFFNSQLFFLLSLSTSSLTFFSQLFSRSLFQLSTSHSPSSILSILNSTLIHSLPLTYSLILNSYSIPRQFSLISSLSQLRNSPNQFSFFFKYSMGSSFCLPLITSMLSGHL